MLKSLRLNQHRWSRKKKLSKKILPARAYLSADTPGELNMTIKQFFGQPLLNKYIKQNDLVTGVLLTPDIWICIQLRLWYRKDSSEIGGFYNERNSRIVIININAFDIAVITGKIPITVTFKGQLFSSFGQNIIEEGRTS